MTTYGWQLRRISGPEIEPVTLDEVKRHAKIDQDITGDDETITEIYIPAAREAVENYTLTTVCESTWEYRADQFPCDGGPLVLPRGPVIAVLGVSYVQNDGTRIELAEGQWSETIGNPGWILPPYGEFWPTGRVESGAVVVTYRAGYAGAGSPADASGVPRRVKHTMLAICTRYIENRSLVDVDDLLLAGVFDLRNFGS